MTTLKRRPINNQSQIFQTSLHPVLQKIYAARGIESFDDLTTGLDSLLPFTELKGINQAVAVLAEALDKQQRILVVGDFDVDGATSTTLAVTALRALGGKHIEFLVPNRFAYGYGLTQEIVEVAARWKPDVIVTVDNGISSVDGVAAANAVGIKVVVTDHHLAGHELPAAAAIVNPNQDGCNFPSKNLAGVGVIFNVMLALRSHLRDSGWFEQQGTAVTNMSQYLDLVALGTVADVVSLDKNNRCMVQQGLQRIRAGKCRPGILALLEIGKRNRVRLNASDLGYALAPRLNAAGRLDDMALGIECLLAEDPQAARTMALQLDELNFERRNIESDMKEQAFAALNKLELNDQNQAVPIGLCLYDESWHQGVVGILASRVKDKMHRPTIAFAKADDGSFKGSARSVKGLHIRDVFDAIATANPGLITKFGGHAMAAGLSLDADKFELFKASFELEVAKHLSISDCEGELLTDGELGNADFSMDLADILKEASPWGQSFPAPLFEGKFRLIQQRIVGVKHLKMTLSPVSSEQIIEAIAFNVDLERWPNSTCAIIRCAYRLDVNEYQGRRSLQLLIEHIEECPA